MIDIRDYPDELDLINAVLNSGNRCEVANEKRRGSDNIVIVKLTRQVVTKKPDRE